MKNPASLQSEILRTLQKIFYNIFILKNQDFIKVFDQTQRNLEEKDKEVIAHIQIPLVKAIRVKVIKK